MCSSDLAGYCEYMYGSARQAAAHVRRALDLAHASGHLTETIPLLNGLAVSHHHAGCWKEALETFESALALARRIGDDAWACTITTNISGLMVNVGNRGEAISFGTRAVELARRVLNQPRSIMAYTNLSCAYLLAGNQSKALQCLEEGSKLLNGGGNWEPRILLYGERASILIALGNIPEALQSIALLEKEMDGQSRLGQNGGCTERLKAFRAKYTVGASFALDQARDARSRFRDRNLLHYLSVNAAVAWLEREVDGKESEETNEGIRLFEPSGMMGLRDFLRLGNFLK